MTTDLNTAGCYARTGLIVAEVAWGSQLSWPINNQNMKKDFDKWFIEHNLDPSTFYNITPLHSGGKFDNAAYKVSGGLHGVGAAAVNALSEWMEVTVKRDGYVWQQRYERGIPQTPVEKVRKLKRGEQKGTSTVFRFDDTIFEKDAKFRFENLMNRFREMAFVTSGVHLRLVDERKDPGLWRGSGNYGN